MDALQQAKRAADNADWKKEPDDTHEELELAMMYAAIAQAEAEQAQAAQLKRIADALENLGGAYATAMFGALPSE